MDYGHKISRLIGKTLNETMIQSLTILTVLRLLTDAKISCTRGYVTYERVPNYRLIGFQEKMVSHSENREIGHSCWINSHFYDC